MLARSVEGGFGGRCSLRSTKWIALCVSCARLLFCLRSRRSGSFESNLCDGTVDRGRGQLRSDAIAYLLYGVFHCAERTKEADCHWKGMVCCCILSGVVHTVLFQCPASTDAVVAVTENLFSDRRPLVEDLCNER